MKAPAAVFCLALIPSSFAWSQSPVEKPLPATPTVAPISIAPLPELNLPVRNEDGTTSVPHTTLRRAKVDPNVAFNTIIESQVQDIHLRPLFVTAIRLPFAVTSVVVGAPTLFEAEHKDQEPNLVFVKPSTHKAVESNLLVAMSNGETVSVRLISPGDVGSADPVDFVVDYHNPRSLFGDQPGGGVVAVPPSGQAPVENGLTGLAARTTPVPALDAEGALVSQESLGAPNWLTAKELSKMIKADAKAPNTIAIAIGPVRQEGMSMTVSFSVLNVSDHWESIMPPQVEVTNPLQSKKDKKKNGTYAVPIAAQDYKLQNPKLAPGSRADGSITFPKPDSKLAREGLLLNIATSAAIDTPVYCPLPFVAPSESEVYAERNPPNAVR